MSEAGTCKTCVHWTPPAAEDIRCYGSKPWEGYCDSDKFEYRECAKDGLSVSDAECYSASFTTGEDFGCIHHKEAK